MLNSTLSVYPSDVVVLKGSLIVPLNREVYSHCSNLSQGIGPRRLCVCIYHEGVQKTSCNSILQPTICVTIRHAYTQPITPTRYVSFNCVFSSHSHDNMGNLVRWKRRWKFKGFWVIAFKANNKISILICIQIFLNDPWPYSLFCQHLSKSGFYGFYIWMW